MDDSAKISTLQEFDFWELQTSSKSLSNTTTNILWKDLLANHADAMDNDSSGAVNSVLESVNSLVPNKKNLKNISKWQCRLSSSVPDPIEILKAQSDLQCSGKSCYPFEIKSQDLKKLSESKYVPKQPMYLVLNEKKSVGIKAENIAPTKEKVFGLFHPKLQTTNQWAVYKSQANNCNTANEVIYKGNSDAISDKAVVKSNSSFKTAKQGLIESNPSLKRTLGSSRAPPKKFISPFVQEQEEQQERQAAMNEEQADERLRHIDPKMIELIQSEIIDNGAAVGWEDIAGLEMAKSVIQEAVVWPLLRPDIFTGLRRPPKGILLFGPPGTGKTLIGKCVASQCNATFFNISASSLTSKWIGDGEKMVRALFAVARCHQPAVIFIDEIDSLLTQRNDAEHEATRRIKTEFLVQFDGAATADEDSILIIGATNRPQELDEAARRRLVKRLYIPLPDLSARRQIISKLMSCERNELTSSEIEEVSNLTEGFSGADMRSLCSEAAMGPIRSLPMSQITKISTQMVRAIKVSDFKAALQRVRPSVSQDDLGQYQIWNKTFGLGY